MVGRTKSILATLFLASMPITLQPVEATPDVEYTIPAGVLSAAGGAPSVEEAFQQITLWNTWTDGQLNLETIWQMDGGTSGDATFLLAVYEVREYADLGIGDPPDVDVKLVAQDMHTEEVTSSSSSEGTLSVGLALEGTQQLLALQQVKVCDTSCVDATWLTSIAPGSALLTFLTAVEVVGEGTYCIDSATPTETPFSMAVNTDSSIMVQRLDRSACIVGPCDDPISERICETVHGDPSPAPVVFVPMSATLLLADDCGGMGFDVCCPGPPWPPATGSNVDCTLTFPRERVANVYGIYGPTDSEHPTEGSVHNQYGTTANGGWMYGNFYDGYPLWSYPPCGQFDTDYRYAEELRGALTHDQSQWDQGGCETYPAEGWWGAALDFEQT